MEVTPTYSSLPFTWNPKTILNDCQWLESIINNSAPFSDAWIKTRIVQLAYPQPPISSRLTCSKNLALSYRGLSSEQEIADIICSEFNPDHSPLINQTVNGEYVTKTLNDWHNKQFSTSVSRNFEIYADRQHPNIFLVTSTALPSLNYPRHFPPLDRFRPLFNMGELVTLIDRANCERITLRTHGYSVTDQLFYKDFIEETKSLTENPITPPINSLKSNHFYIGYHWPSESPIVSPSLWNDYLYTPEILIKFLFVMGGIALSFSLIISLLFSLLGMVSDLKNLWDLNLEFSKIFLTVLTLWLILIQFLRILVYQRDRYRVIHYGSPDLAEFFWRLDHHLNQDISPQPRSNSSHNLHPLTKISVNLIGHSMGALLLVNVLRILSDRFGKDDRSFPDQSGIGDHLKLDNLILISPDIPLEFLREGRNNYVRSAILRCQKIYLMSSDRDTVLRYLSTIVNWMTEPSLEMSGLRLGNVYLKAIKDETTPFLPYIRTMIFSQPAIRPTSAYDLFEKFNYLDCSEMKGLNQVNLPLNPWTSVLIDLINTGLFFIKKLDVHGGYFATNTPSFQLIKFIITQENIDEESLQNSLRQLMGSSKIRFLPSQNFCRARTTINSPFYNPMNPPEN